jgi:hypothetical protein
MSRPQSRQRAPHPPPGAVLRTHPYPCGKREYESRKEARAALRKLEPGGKGSAYRCERFGGWHWGHLPAAVVRGDASRDELRPTVIEEPTR